MATDDDQHEDDRDGVGVSSIDEDDEIATLINSRIETHAFSVRLPPLRRWSASPHHQYPTKPAMSTNTTMATTANATPPPTSVLRRPRRLSSLASDNALAPEAARGGGGAALVSTRSITSP